MEWLRDMGPALFERWGPEAIRLFLALAFLIGGWVVALLLGWMVKGALKKTTIDDRIAKLVLGEAKSKNIDVETWAGKAVYYIVLLFALAAALGHLGLPEVSRPLLSLLERVLAYVPQLIGAVVLVALAWMLATALRTIVQRGLEMFNLDERVSGEAGLAEGKRPPLSKTLSEAVYWLVFLLFLPNILSVLGLVGLLQPVQNMIQQMLGFLPSLLRAGLILVAGWFVARVVQRIVTNLLSAAGADSLGEKIGLGSAAGTRKLSGLLGLIVYVFILFTALLSSLNKLELDAITEPASNMLGQIMAAVPNIFVASILLGLAFYVGKLAAELLANVLAGVGFNNVLQKLGLAKAEPEAGERTPSEIVGLVLVTVIMLTAAIQAAGILGFDDLAMLLSGLLEFAGQLVLAIAVFGIGLFLANLAAGTIRSSGSPQAGILATAARVAIVVLASAVALRHLNVANEIIELAFGLLLGSVAVAVAIAFGLGGRDVAAKQIEEWRQSLKS